VWWEGGGGGVMGMVLNATFNNISVISWRSVLCFIGGGSRSTRRKPPTSAVLEITT